MGTQNKKGQRVLLRNLVEVEAGGWLLEDHRAWQELWLCSGATESPDRSHGGDGTTILHHASSLHKRKTLRGACLLLAPKAGQLQSRRPISALTVCRVVLAPLQAGGRDAIILHHDELRATMPTGIVLPSPSNDDAYANLCISPEHSEHMIVICSCSPHHCAGFSFSGHHRIRFW